MIERELKLALPGRFDLPSLELDGAPLEVDGRREVTLRATYYDTADLRLARHGVTLRFRTGEERGPLWTLKLPVSVSGATVARRELHFDSPRREPPREARALVTAFTRAEPLVAVATLRTRRRVSHLLRDGAPVAELADDEVSVVEGRRVVSRFRELEVEALTDNVELEAIEAQLRRAGATAAEPIPKVVRALGARATAPPDAGPAPLPTPPTMADALTAAIGDALERLVRNDPLARLGEAEGIHQVRVALRRLRSDLRTLGDAVDEGWRSRIEPRLREVADALGAARDLDVLTASVRAEAAEAEGTLAPLFRHLETKREVAAGTLKKALEDPDYVGLLDALVDAVASPPVGPRASEPASAGLARAVLTGWRRLESRAAALRKRSPEQEFHSVRIAAKRTRYAAELAARVLDGKAAAGATALGERVAVVQDALGRVQDAAVAQATIRSALDGPRVGASYAFEAGRLVERSAIEALAARADFFKAWSATRRRRWRRWAM